MSGSNLIRWSGLAGIVGIVLLFVTVVMEDALFGGMPTREPATTSMWQVIYLLYLVAVVLLMLALIGLYARQAAKAGAFGLIAFLVGFVGLVLMSGNFWGGAFMAPSLAAVAPEALDALNASSPTPLEVGKIATFSLFFLGWLLFGLASLLVRVLPRGAAALVMLGIILSAFVDSLGFPINHLGSLVLAAGIAWMGFAVWSEKMSLPTTPAMEAQI